MEATEAKKRHTSGLKRVIMHWLSADTGAHAEQPLQLAQRSTRGVRFVRLSGTADGRPLTRHAL